jgi:hypothetical protein
MNKKPWLKVVFGLSLLSGLIAMWAGRANLASHYIMEWRGPCPTGGSGMFVTQGFYNCYGFVNRYVTLGGYALIALALFFFVLILWDKDLWARMRSRAVVHLANIVPGSSVRRRIANALRKLWVRTMLAGLLALAIGLFALSALGLAMEAEGSRILGILFTGFYMIASALLFIPGFLISSIEPMSYRVTIGILLVFFEIILLFELIHVLLNRKRAKMSPQTEEKGARKWIPAAAAFIVMFGTIIYVNWAIFQSFERASQPLGPTEPTISIIQTVDAEAPYRKYLEGREAVAYVNELTDGKYFLPDNMSFVSAGNFEVNLPEHVMIDDATAEGGISFLFPERLEMKEFIRGSEVRPLPELQNSRTFKTKDFTWEMGKAPIVGGTVAIGSRGDLVIYLRTVEGSAYDPPKDLRAFIEANF